ncbi:MAG TPA: serine/threonine-protein kinase [Anaerolineales bacterium]|nr:serine/threonine-protein kinase [Anaerolineales bacterium]
MSFNVGENVGPYRIIEQLGQGGMATVYKAYHAALDRYVAIKALHPAFGEDQSFLARFQREARLIAKLEHPNIVPVYDYAEHEGRPYLVMKFIEGDTLKARLTKGPLTSAEIEKVVDTVGSALAYAHKQGILHRDIKPSNVLVANDGQLYLADFGLARIAQSGESTLSSDMIMGTPQYISPEQAMGKKDLDEGTDIYSFGVMIYEMVVGQVPFNADTPFSIIHDHIYSPLPLPHSVNPKVPESVERVLLRALAKERADRYPDVDSLVTAFKEAWTSAGVPMQGTAITLRPAQLKATTSAAKTVAAKGASKKRASPWPFIAGIVVLILACLFVLFVLRTDRLLKTRASATATVLAQAQSPITPMAVTASPLPDATTAPSVSPAAAATQVPAVATAQGALTQNPGDPNAALNLSLAYWDAGQNRQSLVALSNAASLAGQSNTQFFSDAGDQFKQRQAWLPAAAMYLRAVKSLGFGGKPTQDMVDNYHQALYQAAAQPDIQSYLPFTSLSDVEQPMAMVAEARYDFYNGNPSQAQILLNQVKQIRPGMPEASLLQAEMDAKNGKTFEAKQLLQILIGDLNAADWVRAYAQNYLNEIP